MTPLRHGIGPTYSLRSKPNAVRRGASQSRGIMKGPNGHALGASIATQGNGVRKVESPPMEDHRKPGIVFRPPSDCRRLVIVGAGGFGREVLQWARDAWPEHAERIAGFLSDDPGRLDGFSTGLEILGPVASYEPRPGDYLLLGIGVAYSRRVVAERLSGRGAEFATLVHPRAVVARSARLGQGSIVCPGAIISDSARLGACVLVNYHASLGHDSSAGDFAVLSPYATLGGGARIGDDVFLGLHASVGPGRSVGSRSKVSANSCLLSNAPSDSLVYGVPGRISPRIGLTEDAP
jgi:sugar O-acyltransferase (sialic acid O-acetyltransferase NeuD family)